jgi:hypothetical protein
MPSKKTFESRRVLLRMNQVMIANRVNAMNLRTFKACVLSLFLVHSNAFALCEKPRQIHLSPPLYVTERQLRALSNQFDRGVLSSRKLIVLVYGGNEDGIAAILVPIDKGGLDSQCVWLDHDGKFKDLGTADLDITYSALVGNENVPSNKRLWLTTGQVKAMTIRCQHERMKTNDLASILFFIRTSQGLQFRIATSPSKPYGAIMCVTNSGAIQEANPSLLPVTENWKDHFGLNGRLRKPSHSK